MKLLLCPVCSDVFKLTTSHIRRCDCGRVAGRYDPDGRTAVTNGQGISLAIDNNTVRRAVWALEDIPADTPKDQYSNAGSKTLLRAWVRPNDGPGNNRCRIEPDLDIVPEPATVSLMKTKRTRTPHQKIMRAMARGAGLRLSADDVWRLSLDDAIATRAISDDEGTSLLTASGEPV